MRPRLRISRIALGITALILIIALNLFIHPPGLFRNDCVYLVD